MKNALGWWLGAGLMLGSAACATELDLPHDDDLGPPGQSDDSAEPQEVDERAPGQKPGAKPNDPMINPGEELAPSTEVQVPGPATLAKLVVASDCGDLLTKIQDDAVAKLKMQVELAKKQAQQPPVTGGVPGGADAGAAVRPPNVGTPQPASDLGGVSAGSGGDAKAGGESAPSTPTAASGTNKQVADVDEADFVKVVESGKGIFVLHGNMLQKLKSWPAAETALVGSPLVIEGSPSEMFVSEQGKAVIFSRVYDYAGSYPPGVGGGKPAIACTPEGDCFGGYGGTKLKITVADVSTDQPKVERELYYEGSYLSSRRYASSAGDVVRAVIQANSKSVGLYSPAITWTDPWGRPYESDEIASQLDEWERRTTAAIRKTTLTEWIPTAQEVAQGKLVDIAPACDSYFVPQAGLSDYGLTHVLTLDISKPMSQVGGVTIVGASSTVYSNASRLVLAQPDYRWSPAIDFGISDTQQTALHVFDLAAEQTQYVASGWVFGTLPAHNPQFGIDVAPDGTVRVATTGRVRTNPEATPEQPDFWQQSTENYVITAQVMGNTLAQVGRSVKLGHENETVQSARFVGDRAYVVTYWQKDPLYVLDVANAAAPTVLGEIEIPGFGYYMHPLDQNHLITAGESGQRSTQLQLFDVTDPKNIPQPKVLDFGASSSSVVSFDHKALTYFDGYLALPMYSYGRAGPYEYRSSLEVVKVDAATGFEPVASIDHTRLYANNGAGVSCGVCDAVACYEYSCGYNPEVRRGHFVQGEGKTYVYSFSYAGVLVNDLASPTRPVASVGLPAPQFQGSQPWYGSDGLPLPPAVPTDGGMTTPPVDAGAPRPRDAGTVSSAP